MIKQLLKQLGFKDKEIIIYLEILKQGKISPADLAKTTNINRTTVYAIVEELVKKSVIKKDLGTPTATLVALPPEKLNSMISEKEQKLRQEKNVVEELVYHLKKVTQEAKYPIPKITFIEEKNLNNYLYKQTPIWNQSMLENKTSFWGFRDKTFIAHYYEWIDWYWKEFAELKKFSLKLLTNQSEIELEMLEKKYPGREIKFWAGSDEFTASTWICGDYVCMAMTKNHPHYLVEIYDKLLAQNQRIIFKKLWEIIK